MHGHTLVRRWKRLRFLELHRFAAAFERSRSRLVTQNFGAAFFTHVAFSKPASKDLSREYSGDLSFLASAATSERTGLPHRRRVVGITVTPETSLAALAPGVDMKDVTAHTPVSGPETALAQFDRRMFALRPHFDSLTYGAPPRLHFVPHDNKAGRAFVRAQSAAFTIIVIEYVVAAIARGLRGFQHGVVRTQRPTVVAGKALAA